MFQEGPDVEPCLHADSNLSKIAWWCDNAGKPATTHPGKQLMPNGWGIYDMPGNVMEWVNDSFNGLWHGPGLVSDLGGVPTVDGTGQLRGGAANQWSAECRVAYHYPSTKNVAGAGAGLRLVQTIHSKSSLSLSRSAWRELLDGGETGRTADGDPWWRAATWDWRAATLLFASMNTPRMAPSRDVCEPHHRICHLPKHGVEYEPHAIPDSLMKTNLMKTNIVAICALVVGVGCDPSPMTVDSGDAGGMDAGAALPLKDIQYRTDLDESFKSQVSLDVYYADEQRVKPVVVFFHGGGWISGTKDGVADPTVSDLGRFFDEQGYLLVSANYRLVNVQALNAGGSSPRFPDQASDVAHAIAWVKKNISKYGGDPDTLVVSGHSAGAHLVPLVVSDPQYLAATGLDASAVKKVICFDVHAYDIPYGLTLMAADVNYTSQISSMKRMFGSTEAEQRVASPSNYISGSLPPMLILSAGIKEGAPQTISRDVSKAYVERLVSGGVTAYHYHYPNEDHASLVVSITGANDQPARAVEAFLANTQLP